MTLRMMRMFGYADIGDDEEEGLYNMKDCNDEGSEAEHIFSVSSAVSSGSSSSSGCRSSSIDSGNSHSSRSHGTK